MKRYANQKRSAAHRRRCRKGHFLPLAGIKSHRCKSARGSQIHKTKLTPHDVRMIRYAYAHTSLTQSELGDMFDVSPLTVSSVITGKTWKWVK